MVRVQANALSGVNEGSTLVVIVDMVDEDKKISEATIPPAPHSTHVGLAEKLRRVHVPPDSSERSHYHVQPAQLRLERVRSNYCGRTILSVRVVSLLLTA